jgi:predicted dehydrogenase
MRPEEWRRSGQIIFTGSAKIEGSGGKRLFPSHPFGSRRVRLLGFCGGLATGATPLLELSQGGRRGDHGRHVLSLALCPRRSLRTHTLGMSLGRHPYSPAVDENGNGYSATADDAACAIFELEGGIIAQLNSSWCVRVYRDELLSLQVDGTHGSAIAGLHSCKVQHRVSTPKPVWNPDVPSFHNFFEDWQEIPANNQFDNGFKVQWELFIRHVVEDLPFKFTLMEGVKGVQLAEAGLESWRQRRWIELPEI